MFTCVWYSLEDKSTVKKSKEAHLETVRLWRVSSEEDWRS